jgi:serine/threonine protein kinase
MGEVYRTRDAKLNREVAIKAVPASLASDPSALARFHVEAQAVATLSHPNIIAMFDFGLAKIHDAQPAGEGPSFTPPRHVRTRQ